MKKLILPLTIIAFLACNPSPTPPTETSSKNISMESMSGDWRSIEVSFSLDAKSGTPSKVIAAKEVDFPEVLQISANTGTYRMDSTFTDNYYDLNGTVAGSADGNWYMKNDSMYIHMGEKTHVYLVKQMGDTASFTGWVDYDEDGMKDDLFEGMAVVTREE